MGKAVHTLGSKKKSQIASLDSDKLRPRLKPTEATDAVAAKDCRKLPNVLGFPPPPPRQSQGSGEMDGFSFGGATYHAAAHGTRTVG